MSDYLEVVDEEKRKGRDRRRYPHSMIRNYAEYSGPERRSGADRRRAQRGGARSGGPTIRSIPQSRRS